MNWNNLPREFVRRGIERCGFGGENALCQLAWIQPGAELRPHRHDFEQLVLILEGECLFHVDGVPHACTQGSLLRIPANAEHYVEVVGDKPVFEMDIFAPVRPDCAHLLDHQRGEWTRVDAGQTPT
jgi:quercetin dioxygenase-like cupin family protein